MVGVAGDGEFGNGFVVEEVVGPLGAIDHQSVEILHHVVVLIDWARGLGVVAVALDFEECAMTGGRESEARGFLEDRLEG